MPTEEPSERQRNEHGQYSDRLPAKTALDVFEKRTDRGRPLTANDVMEALDCSRRTAHNKLNELVEREMLATRKVGARGRVWWVPIEQTESQVNAEDESFVDQGVIEEIDLPGTGPTLESRQDALRAAYDYLIKHPSAKKSDFLQDVFPEHPAGYETADGWWNAIQPALKDLPGVDPPEERGHIWHFLGG
ncbi:ArsR family transcriptional regulator [Haladaptatus sp. DFWS20]|uniref:ArsR family transcriptional regulator n=1 Tax=Haladaptatus sp. DFWS20 TaxID=3403467 RepID=UPI003EBF4FF9